MIKQKIVFLALIFVIALAVVVSGCACSKEINIGGNTTIGTPSSTVTAPITAPTTVPAGPTAAPGTAKVYTQGKTVKIIGNGVAQSSTFKLPENWYAVKVTYEGSKKAGQMDYFDLELSSDDNVSSTGVGLSQAGTKAYYSGIHYPETSQSTSDTYYVRTLDPTAGAWSVELTAPPAESSVQTAPYTFTGTGQSVVGPIKLPTRNGKATITYNGPKDYFGVSFLQQDINYPTYPSFFIDLPASSMDNIGSSGLESSITKTVDIDNFDPNLMLLMSVDCPQDGSWSITISPSS